MIEQAGQAVGAAQGAEAAFMFSEFHRQVVADPANSHWVQRQHRQARIDLHGGGLQLQTGAEQGDRKPPTQALNQQPFEEQALTACGEVVHRHHRQNRHAGQGIELHGCGPEPTHQRIEQQVAVLGVVWHASASSKLKGQMGPDQAIEQQQRPGPLRDVQAGNTGHNGKHADTQANNARQVDPPDK
ncbi:hypothetical protein D3C79_808620 [compost metagenome]